MNRLFTQFKAVFLIIGLFFCLFLNTHWAPAVQDKTKPSQEQAEVTSFEYVIEDRADPFVPFITDKSTAPTIDMNEIVEKNETLTGMQLFEPGQLTLVALLRRGNENIAMVQDFTGKGYVITEGTKIGRRGVVKDITSKNVIIEETAETRAGKKIITEVVMSLKKEGEE
jgi:type IV pilus assembly protein PilP